jgi:hypothetical protein
VFTFTQPHDVTTVGRLFIIRFFSDEVNGVYEVISIPSINQLVAVFSFVNVNQITSVGNGIGFVLQTQRVKQASDVITLPYANSLIPGNKVWVDNNGSGLWQVLEKQLVFTSTTEIKAAVPQTNSQFGTSVAQSKDNVYAIVGSPGYNPAADSTLSTGAAYTYIRTVINPLAENSVLELNAVDTIGYGHSVSIGNQTWQAIGAPASDNNLGYATTVYRIPGSGTFLTSSVLTVPVVTDLVYPAEFGYSVAISQDEHWMYIGAPGINKVFAYGLVEVQNQTKTYVTNGTAYIFNYSDYIVIDFLDPN